ncbi:hypothetical protein M9H77_16551 [Catharanthus roseus]|uniref:Uncharacterized protein n=1 Tax=Catharanthus roseus TaxID=4058 RepID=A0ACC0B2G6_CATRO|nr:hypothetical protein M9H77_16551 [Catharanthus roseus]
MGRLVAKLPNALCLPINKGLPKVETLQKHLSLQQKSSSKFKYFLVVFLTFFLPKIKESSRALPSINHPQSPFHLRRSFQALKLTLCQRKESEDYPTYYEFPKDFVTTTIS